MTDTMRDRTIDTITLPLFLPADRMDRFAKAAAAGADAVIVDLEDAVAPEAKEDARGALTTGLPAEPGTAVLVRINGADSPWFEADLAAVAALPLAGIILPKAERADVCRTVAARTGRPVVGLVETAAGLHAANPLAEATARLAFGSIDYAADLGMGHTRESLLHARSTLVLAARLAGRPAPLDGVTTAIRDPEAVTEDARHALTLGLGGKLLIHPAQVAPARAGFAPTESECEWARRVLAASASSAAAVAVDGAMVDAPVIKRAEAILARAEAAR